MCGVFGSFMRLDRADVADRLDRIAHRGPDGRGVVEVGVAVHGHVRLALLDLSDASAQPFRRAGGVLSWVGEVWNHFDIKNELQGTGERFSTMGDTEALAAILSRWGCAGLPRVDGMFAGAWSDGRGEHWLFRDRWGKVPLHVLRRGGSFEWSSERRALSDPGAAVSLPPGSALSLTTGKLTAWHDPARDERPEAEASEPAWVLDRLRDGVRRRLAADAPVCVLCSGGLDSSLIVALAKEAKPRAGDVTAFVATVGGWSVDGAAARDACRFLDVPLIEVEVPSPTAETLADAVRAIESHSVVQAEIACLCVPLAKRIRAEGFKACLSGEAADELFGGYGNTLAKASSLDDRGWRAHRREMACGMARKNFARCNKAFMAGGVECRLPFMERRLAEGVLALGKRGCPPGKGLLREAARGLLPPWLIERSKETFQGGSTLSEIVAARVHDPAAFVRAECRRLHGGRLPRD